MLVDKSLKIIASICLFIALIFAFVWFGFYNISAKDKHWAVTDKLLEITRERSIAARSGNINVPTNLADEKMISNGAKNYDAMCSQCHLAPEMQATELNLGLYPKPPVFYLQNHVEHQATETFWTIKNGLKLTGMPAWGDFHTDKQMWEMVAFLDQLNGMTEKQYDELVGEGGHTHKAGAHASNEESKHGKVKEKNHHNNSAKQHTEVVPKGHDNSDGHHNTVEPKGHDNSDGHHNVSEQKPERESSEHEKSGHAH